MEYITKTPVSDLKLWDRNPRSIKDNDFNRLKDQITLLGQYKPILVTDDNTVIGGNMRLRALREIGVAEVYTARIDFVEEDGLWYAVIAGEKQKKPFTSKLQGMTEYALSDNDRAGYYDQDLLANLLGEVDIDLSAYSIDLSEPVTIQDLLNGNPDVKEDEPPAVDAENTYSEPGKVYQLGRHRLICGDATKVEDIERLMNGQKADMIFTDPPYNVDYEGKTEDALKIQNDKFGSSQEFYQFLLDSFTAMNAVSKTGASIYVCHADSEGLNFRKAFIEAGFLLKQCLIWNKNTMVMGRQDYHWKHEPILYGWKDGGSHLWHGDRTQTTVWDIERPSSSEEHPTMKPIALIVKAIQNSSKGEDIILDTFGGSGSTLIGAEQSGRTCYMSELDPKYVDVIRKRYHKLTHETEDGWQEATPEITP